MTKLAADQPPFTAALRSILMKQLLSPKQVALSMGVSESSLKRWCDQGLIPMARTPGGHRRLEIGAVVRFLRETQRPLIDANAIGLPSGVAGASSVKRPKLDQAIQQLVEHLTAGNNVSARRQILDSYLSGSTIVELCEDLLAPAMHEVGELWTCGSVEVFQERRACEIIDLALHDLRSILPTPKDDAPVAMGGAPAGDNYRLPSLMVEMTLLDAGWRATSLGSDLPFKTLEAAAHKHQPDLMWLSLSGAAIEPDESGADLQRKLAGFACGLPKGVRLVVGGRALTEAKIASLPNLVICPTLRELFSLVRTEG